MEEIHDKYMRLCVKEAEKALRHRDVPVGCVIVYGGKVVAKAHNEREKKNDPTAHAEILALKKAAKRLRRWNLSGCDLYVTLEPCPMCSGALVFARVREVFFGAFDPKAGCCGTVMNLADDQRFNHRVKVTGGIMEKECGALLSQFFASLRKSGGKRGKKYGKEHKIYQKKDNIQK